LILRRFFLGLLILTLSTGATPEKRQEIVNELALTPARNFAGDLHEYDDPVLTVVYRGDDYDVPVYSLAVSSVCIKPTPENDCGYDESKFVARIVRPPILDPDDRPRSAGYRLLSALAKRKANSRPSIRDALDHGLVQWLEANIAECDGAIDAMEAVRQANWKTEPSASWNARFNPNPDGVITLSLHADTVTISYIGDNSKSSYVGVIEDYNTNLDDSSKTQHVSAMVAKLNETLEPCWTKANSKPPWHRKYKFQSINK